MKKKLDIVILPKIVCHYQHFIFKCKKNKGAELSTGHEMLMIYRCLLYMWMYLGMAYISLIINLVLGFIHSNAESLTKEIRSIIEEKVRAFHVEQKFLFKIGYLKLMF